MGFRHRAVLLLLVGTLSQNLDAAHPVCLKSAALLNARPADSVFAQPLTSDDIRKLKGGVYQIRLANEEWGLLRIDYEVPQVLESNIHDTDFEVFAANFSQTLGKPLPVPRRVTVPRRAIAKLAEMESEEVNPHLKIALKNEAILGASLLPFFPGSSGTAFLKEKTGQVARQEIRYLLAQVQTVNGKKWPPADQDFEHFNHAWSETNGRARMTIVEDFQKIFPGETFSEKRFPEQLKSKLAGENPNPIKNIEMMAFEHLPHNVRTELAEAWAVATVLGIPDVHASNWMIHEDHVTPIDLANRSINFTSGSPEIVLWKQQNPINGGRLTPELIHQFQSLFTPAFVDKLKNLTIAQVQAAAAESNFAVSERQANGMIGRARALVPKP